MTAEEIADEVLKNNTDFSLSGEYSRTLALGFRELQQVKQALAHLLAKQKGMLLVPEEPTEERLDRGRREYISTALLEEDIDPFVVIYKAW